MKNRKLLLNGDVEPYIIQSLIQAILDINTEDEMIETVDTGYTRQPIHLFINTPGGSVYDGFALIDVIQSSTTPVYTYAVGSAMSMGLLIYAVGHKRFVGRYSTLMFHDVSSAVADKLEGIQDRIKELRRIQAMICTIVVNNSNIPLEALATKLSRREDWYISAEEAMEYQLAENFLEKF